MNLKEFGVYFAKLREASGYESQRQLAEESGVSHSTINRLESGSHKTSADNLKKLAKYLRGVTANELLEKAGITDELDDRNDNNNPVDPDLSVFFKDFASAPKEKQEEFLRVWELISAAERNRKPGQKQGE